MNDVHLGVGMRAVGSSLTLMPTTIPSPCGRPAALGQQTEELMCRRGPAITSRPASATV